MFEIYLKKINGIWFGVTIINQQILSTAFSLSSDRVKTRLVNNVPSIGTTKFYIKLSRIANHVLSSMKLIFNGNDDGKNFNLVNENLSIYAWKILKIVDMIKPGYITSYGNIARVSGGSPRSVGQVMRLNPYPLIIPCHRVIKSDLSIGGYSGDIGSKLELLIKEKRGIKKSLEVSINRKNLEIFPVELTLKTI